MFPGSEATKANGASASPSNMSSRVDPHLYCVSRPTRARRNHRREPKQSPPRGRNLRGQDQGAGRRSVADRARLRQRLHHAARQEPEGGRDRDDLDGLAGARHRARRRRPAARPRRRDLRAGILGQDDAHPACDRRGAEEGRRLRLRRRRACARSGLRPQARRQSRGAADLAARHGRAGAGDHRHSGALGRGRCAGRRSRSRR